MDILFFSCFYHRCRQTPFLFQGAAYTICVTSEAFCWFFLCFSARSANTNFNRTTYIPLLHSKIVWWLCPHLCCNFSLQLHSFFASIIALGFVELPKMKVTYSTHFGAGYFGRGHNQTKYGVLDVYIGKFHGVLCHCSPLGVSARKPEPP